MNEARIYILVAKFRREPARVDNDNHFASFFAKNDSERYFFLRKNDAIIAISQKTKN
jgi:hypothetical protein